MKFPVRLRPLPSAGFTLIELIGALAILTLLALVATEGVLGRLKQSLRQDEAARLQEIAEGLRRGVVQQRIVPAETNWAPLIAGQLARPVAGILQNSAGWNRRLVFDPNFRLGSPAVRPPFFQTAAGSAFPTQTRAVFLSTLASDFPSLGSVTFEDLWECPPGRLPAHWSSRWAGTAADLLIERVSFGTLFRRIYLNNHNLDSPAWFALDTTNQVAVIPAGSRIEATFLMTSQLLLLGRDGVIQQSVPIADDASFAFEADIWRAGLTSGLARARNSLAEVYDRFAGQSATGRSASPAEVALVMHEFVGEYNRWAGGGFTTVSAFLGEPTPSFRRVQEAGARLGDFTGFLLGSNPAALP